MLFLALVLKIAVSCEQGRVMNKHWLFFGLLAMMAFTPGCGPDVQALCNEQEKCLGGNDADVAACVAAYDGTRENAFDIGCGEEYDALIDCISPQYTCNAAGMCMTSDDCNGSACIDGECKVYGLDATNADACQSQLNAYSRCD
jgi:hypothetical protein